MHGLERTRSQNTVTSNIRNIDKRKYLQMHLFSVMFHGGPVRLGEEWGSPSKVKIVLTGINSASVLEISAEDAC